jgi:Zn-dependent peptidase ImmA (M78 family)
MNKIKILGKEYNIIYFENVSNKNLEMVDNMGLSNMAKCEIHINKNLPEDQKNDTLLHEIIHMISDELCVKLKEDQITILATALYCIFKENEFRFIEIESKKDND